MELGKAELCAWLFSTPDTSKCGFSSDAQSQFSLKVCRTPKRECSDPKVKDLRLQERQSPQAPEIISSILYLQKATKDFLYAAAVGVACVTDHTWSSEEAWGACPA